MSRSLSYCEMAEIDALEKEVEKLSCKLETTRKQLNHQKELNEELRALIKALFDDRHERMRENNRGGR